MEYFFAIGSEQRGPVTLEQLATAGLKPDTLVWRDGLPEWTAADALPELAALFQSPQAATGAATPVTPVAPPGGPVPSPVPALAYQTSASVGGSQNGMAIAALVLGIVALVTMICDGFGLIPGILAIIFGVLARKQIGNREAQGWGMATAGLICGSIAVGLVVLGIIAIVIVIAVANHH
jgi:hypothetical protein